MKHRSSQILFAHWNEKRASRPAPERGEIDPGGIRNALGDTFILTYNILTNHPFRLAGTRVCALFGRELRSHPFVRLWDAHERRAITDLIRAAADDSVGVVAATTGGSGDFHSVELELLLLPLRHCGQTHLRMIGALAPLTTPYWLGMSPITKLSLGDHRFLGHTAMRPALVSAAASVPRIPRIRRGLVVYDGGQS